MEKSNRHWYIYSGINNKGLVYDFSISCKNIEVTDIADIHKYLMKHTILFKCLATWSKHILFWCWINRFWWIIGYKMYIHE